MADKIKINSEGTSLEEAMEKWKTYEDVPEEFK